MPQEGSNLSESHPSLASERLLSFVEAVQYLPTINGRRHAPSTLYRWCRHGIGGVRLEYIRIGRRMATSREALARFFSALAAADDGATAMAELNGSAADVTVVR